MKADIIEEDSSEWFDVAVLTLAAFGILCLFLIRHAALRCTDPFDVLRKFPDESLVVEQVGETSTEYLFSISISTLKENFDLNMIYNALRGTKCRLISTADSAHPSYRKLGLAVPKSTSHASLSSLTIISMAVAAAMLVFELQKVYNWKEEVASFVASFSGWSAAGYV